MGESNGLEKTPFPAWLGLTAVGSFNLGNLGCGGRGFSVGTLLKAPAQRSAQDRNVELLFQKPVLN